MLISITEDDIDNGKPTAESCPIALAAQRATGVPSLVYYSFYGERKNGWLLLQVNPVQLLRIPLEKGVAMWAEAYDRTGKGKPFEFNINVKRKK